MCDNERCESSNLYCKTHTSSAFYDKRSLEIINKESFDITDFVCDGRFSTNATLIIAPNQLCDQWTTEYLTKFENNKRVVLVVTSDQYDNLRLADLLFADVVITSYQFISNLHIHRNGIDADRLKSKGVECLTDQSHCLCLHGFKWKRVVLDEVHELGKIARSKSIIGFISELRSEFKWNVSGTPFANGLLSFYLLMGLNTTLRGECLHVDERSNYISQSLPLFRRNTKQSIKKEFGGNIIKEHLKLLTFTQQERAIYDGYELNSKAYNFLIQICCHTELFAETKDLINNCKTFEEIQQVLVEWNKKLLDRYNDDIQLTERNIAAKKAQIDEFVREHGDIGTVAEEDIDYDETYDDELTEWRAQLGVFRNTLTMTKRHAENVRRTYNYLKYTMENLKENIQNECCPICLDEIEETKLTITKCGHRFCLNCISKVTNDSYRAKCPQCNQFITEKDVYVFKEADASKDGSNAEETLEKIIERVKSTKVGNIIHFLKSIDKNDKVIVFSQWDDILTKVGQNLTKYKLKHVFCNGSVYQKKSAIKSFSTNSDVNIIMLSSKNAASGINLTEANKIVLIEPVYGSDQYRESIEAQAIGRADRIGQKRPIDVYRFIIKDTVEEKIVRGTLKENN
jgi:SNF2 family DNA or RNA helicase